MLDDLSSYCPIKMVLVPHRHALIEQFYCEDDSIFPEQGDRFPYVKDFVKRYRDLGESERSSLREIYAPVKGAVSLGNATNGRSDTRRLVLQSQNILDVFCDFYDINTILFDESWMFIGIIHKKIGGFEWLVVLQ